LRGREGDDREAAGPGRDTTHAGPGVDIAFGGPGGDRMFARALVDVPVSGADAIFSGKGDDIVFVRDGEADVVGCGAGRDLVIADSEDVVRRSCERVRIGQPRPTDDDGEVGS
jgi:hypothetical protein